VDQKSRQLRRTGRRQGVSGREKGFFFTTAVEKKRGMTASGGNGSQRALRYREEGLDQNKTEKNRKETASPENRGLGVLVEESEDAPDQKGKLRKRSLKAEGGHGVKNPITQSHESLPRTASTTQSRIWGFIRIGQQIT